MKIRYWRENWHRIWISLYEQMLGGCLDEEKRWEIHGKLSKHRIQLSELTLEHA